jgi:hypothetical protein
VQATIPGAIWLDEPYAHDTIDRAGLEYEERQNLHKYADEGYFTLDVGVSADDAKQFDDDVNRLWREKPRDVCFSYDSPNRRMSEAVESEHRRPRHRLVDIHSFSDIALRLYLDQTLTRYASLILGEPAVPTQSIYFEYGSAQALHRDSIVVPTPRFGELLAAWIALEDIDPRSGALAYVPGSQKIPFYEFGPGEYMFDGRRMSGDDAVKAMRYHDEEMARRGLETKLFTPRRGGTLIWHSALLHGGGPIDDERLTRKSFVVHYSTMANHPTREGAVAEEGRESVWTTSKLLTRDRVSGFDNPLRGELAYWR